MGSENFYNDPENLLTTFNAENVLSMAAKQPERVRDAAQMQRESDEILEQVGSDPDVLGRRVVLEKRGKEAEKAKNKKLRTRTQELEERLADLESKLESAETDQVTQVLTRRAFFNRIDTAHYSANSTLLLLDLDKFKPINDTYGHPVGDSALLAAAKTLKRFSVHIKEAQEAEGKSAQISLIGRLGGDEFAVLVPDSTPAITAELLNGYCNYQTELSGDSETSEEIKTGENKAPKQISYTLEINGEEHTFTASVGIIGIAEATDFNPESEIDSRVLLKAIEKADKLMYRAKGGKRRN